MLAKQLLTDKMGNCSFEYYDKKDGSSYATNISDEFIGSYKEHDMSCFQKNQPPIPLPSQLPQQNQEQLPPPPQQQEQQNEQQLPPQQQETHRQEPQKRNLRINIYADPIKSYGKPMKSSTVYTDYFSMSPKDWTIID